MRNCIVHHLFCIYYSLDLLVFVLLLLPILLPPILLLPILLLLFPFLFCPINQSLSQPMCFTFFFFFFFFFFSDILMFSPIPLWGSERIAVWCWGACQVKPQHALSSLCLETCLECLRLWIFPLNNNAWMIEVWIYFFFFSTTFRA